MFDLFDNRVIVSVQDRDHLPSDRDRMAVM